MNKIEELEQEIHNLTEKQVQICKQIKEYVKGKTFTISKSIYSNPVSWTGTNYKNRKCIIKSVSLYNGDVIFNPLIQNIKTKDFSINTRAFYPLDYFEVQDD